MRFAWLRSKEGSEEAPLLPAAGRATLLVYNVIWWVPVLLVPTGVLSYRAGALGFLIVSVARAVVNAYRINVLPVEAAQRFPLRSP